MRITTLQIRNYRSIKKISIQCSRLLTLLGPNNHGKSNILSALEFGLSTSSKPVEEDFFSNRESDDNTLWVEFTFGHLTNQERNTFRRYVSSNQSVRIRKTARLSDGSVSISYNGWVEAPEQHWLRAENAGRYTRRDIIDKTPLRDLVPPRGRVLKANVEDAQRRYIEEHRAELKFSKSLETSPLLGTKNVGGGVLPEFFLIPAVRDLTDEVKVKSTTTFGRLMKRAVREMAERDERFVEAKTQLETVISSLNDRTATDRKFNPLVELERGIEQELAAWSVRVNIEVASPDIEKPL